MKSLCPSLARLIEELTKLPSIGGKTAQRLAIHLLGRPGDDSQALADAITDAKSKIRPCSVCYNYTETDLCEICSDPKRDRSKICVVEQTSDVISFEKMGYYNGLYHVLGGALSPLDGILQDDIRIQELLKRMEESTQEIVIATNSNRAGEDTALYIARIMEKFDVSVSRIARGIPMGSELEYLDEATLHRAFEDRMHVV